MCHERERFNFTLFPRFFNFLTSSNINIDAAGEHVWRLIEHASSWPEWSQVCTEVWDLPDDGMLVEGTKFGFKLRMAGKNVPFNVTVTQIDHGFSFEWRSTKYSITAIRTICVEATQEGCRVIDDKKFSSPVIPIGLVYPRGLIRRMTESWLSDIKNASESNG